MRRYKKNPDNGQWENDPYKKGELISTWWIIAIMILLVLVFGGLSEIFGYE